MLALRRLGLDAALVAPNEIEVGGRRIAGTGGGQIGEAVVVVGNILVDFAHARMAHAWRAPSAPFRRLAREGLERYLTTLARELQDPPSMASLGAAIVAAYAETLGRPLVPGELTGSELDAIGAAEVELTSKAFTLGGEGPTASGLKIARGVHVFEGRAARADVRASLRVRAGIIEGLHVRGAKRGAAQLLIGRPVGSVCPGCDPAVNAANAVGELLATGG